MYASFLNLSVGSLESLKINVLNGIRVLAIFKGKMMTHVGKGPYIINRGKSKKNAGDFAKFRDKTNK